jgi:hypothetical protein
MTEITGILNGVHATGRVYPLTVESLGTLGSVRIVAASTGIFPYAVRSVKIIAPGGVTLAIIRVCVPDSRGHSMSTLNPPGFIMAKNTDDLLAGMFLGILKPVGPQKLGVVHLMGIVAGGTLDGIKPPQGLSIIPAHWANPRWV